ncbi:MAG: DUF1684 domain-containing protein [Candidatus Wenzhouxiangella sp. M2_3B_020]
MAVRDAGLTVLIALVACVLSACGEGGRTAHSDTVLTEEMFRERNVDWRERRLARLTEPYGWLSLIGLVMLDAGGELRIGAAPGNDVVVPRGPDEWGVLRVDATGRAAVFDALDPAVTVDGERVDSAMLRVDDGDGPTRVEAAGIRMHLVDPGGRLGLRIRDPQAPTRTGFKGLDYFPLNREWRIDAEFVPHPDGKTIRLANVMGQLIDEPNPGRVRFRHDGETITLEAVRSGDRLFFIFADRTSGRETYGLGRFLYADLPVNGRVILDFNQAYNPPCAFTAFTTCSLPPPGNRIDAAVRAGERVYEGDQGDSRPHPVAGAADGD